MTVMRGGRLMRWLGGILGLIIVGKAYRCERERESGLEICGWRYVGMGRGLITVYYWYFYENSGA